MPSAPANAPARPPQRAAWPTVTVAILAFNRREELSTTLVRTLGDLEYPADALEVIVVDNASTDGTGAMLAAEFPAVRVIRLERNVGVSGWNAAFAAGGGGWFLVLDDDCYLEGDTLARAVAAAEAQAADLVSFRVRAAADPAYLFNDEYPVGLLAFWGCSVLVSRRALARVGGFDPNIFLWAHELDFTMRVLDAGFRHLHDPSLVAVHMKAPSPSPPPFVPRAYALNHRNWAYVAGRRLRALDAVRVLGRMAGEVLAQARTDPRRVRVLPTLVAGFARGARRRAPVRPVVSRTYRDNFLNFGSPLEVLRRPWERGGGDAQARRQARWDAFWAARRPFYPAGAAVLEL